MRYKVLQNPLCRLKTASILDLKMEHFQNWQFKIGEFFGHPKDCPYTKWTALAPFKFDLCAYLPDQNNL